MHNTASLENDLCAIGDPPCRGPAPCTDAEDKFVLSLFRYVA